MQCSISVRLVWSNYHTIAYLIDNLRVMINVNVILLNIVVNILGVRSGIYLAVTAERCLTKKE